MLLNSNCRSRAVPVEVSLSLSSMGSAKSTMDESASSGPAAPRQPDSNSLSKVHDSINNLSKQRSTSSSRASLEASIDALVDMQLAALAEAAREPDAGDLAKMALMRTASAPEAPAPKPVAAQTSGLDWSGSIEAGPVLIRTRQDEESALQDNPKLVDLPPKSKGFAVPSMPLARVSEDVSSSNLPDTDFISPRSDQESLSGLISAWKRQDDSSLESSGDDLYPMSLSKQSSASASLAPQATAAFESPFEAVQFQDEPILRPVVLPAVEAEDILKSASVPPVHVTSMLTPVAESSEQGEPEEDTNDERRILSGRVQLPKVNSEAQSLENLRRPADLPRGRSPNRISNVMLDNQPIYHRQAGMKSLSVMETEGIPMIRPFLKPPPEMPARNSLDQEQTSPNPIRMNLAQEGGIKGLHLHRSRPTSARTGGFGVSSRSQTVPSVDLQNALDELQKEARSASGKTQQSRPSHLPYQSSWPEEEDMAASTTLQHDITSFQPVDDSIRSPPRAPSLFDLTGPQISQQSSEWLISWDEIELGRRIGAGSYGEVFRAQWRHTDVAVKRITHMSESLVGLQEFKAEVNLMSKLKHPNIVQFLGACTEYPNLSIITQFMPRGSLFNLLHRAKVRLDNRQKLWMAMDVAKGMLYLHSCRPPIVHGDVSSKNMLVDRDFSIRVADFGMSRQRRKAMLSAKSQGGTAEWTAPEVLRGLPYHEKADVFSFGVILHELMTQTAPWNELSTIQVVGAVGWGNARLQIPENIPEPMQKLMAACMESDPQQRPDFEQIIVSLRNLRREIQLTPPIPQRDARKSLEARKPQSPFLSRESSNTAEGECNECRAIRSNSLESRRTM